MGVKSYATFCISILYFLCVSAAGLPFLLAVFACRVCSCANQRLLVFG
jgi:hypothetical protein